MSPDARHYDLSNHVHALVTGAAGFVGQHLCEHLRESCWEVSATDVNGATYSCDHWAPCDVTQPGELEGLFDRIPPVTHVFHLAALTFVPDAEKDSETARRVNVEGTRRLVEALIRRHPAARLVYISSADVYGLPRFLPVDESHPVQPRNVYASSKAEAEEWCREQHRAGKLDLVVMRPFNHTGPGQSEKFVLPGFARQIARIEAELQPPVMRVGNLEAARDFSHVDDVVRAYELAALTGGAGETYNVCSGVSRRIGDALNQLLAFASVKIAVETDPALVRPVEAPEVRGSHEKLTAATGWQPEIPFDRLLQDLLQYWKET